LLFFFFVSWFPSVKDALPLRVVITTAEGYEDGDHTPFGVTFIITVIGGISEQHSELIQVTDCQQLVLDQNGNTFFCFPIYGTSPSVVVPADTFVGNNGLGNEEVSFGISFGELRSFRAYIVFLVD
jgi:hypothetical protein